jgi:hypothetical protein
MALSAVLLRHQQRLTDSAKDAFAQANQAVAACDRERDELAVRHQQAVRAGQRLDLNELRWLGERDAFLCLSRVTLVAEAQRRQRSWQDEEQKMKGYLKIEEKAQRERAYLAARQEQKMSDEFSARTRGRPQP